MSLDDARRTGETIRQLFFDARMRLPKRVVIHIGLTMASGSDIAMEAGDVTLMRSEDRHVSWARRS
jgi:hypothetical protein